MNIRKRALSILLALVMLLTVLPAGVRAASSYEDVPEDHWASRYVERVRTEGLMMGTSSTTFGPEETITRGMFVAVLARYAGVTTDDSVETGFKDVPAGKYYTGAVAWAVENGIVYGVSTTAFAPNAPVTRQEMAAFLYRTMTYMGNTCPENGSILAFLDGADTSDYAIAAMNWAIGAGIFSGYKDGTLRPQATATRAEAAVVFCGILDYKEESVDPTEPEEPTEPGEPETGYTVTFVGDRGYAKVDGERVTSVTLEPGVNWLSFNLYGDQGTGFDLDDVTATSGTLRRTKSEFILRDITQDTTVSFTTKGMILTVNFRSKAIAEVEPASVQVAWGQTVSEPTATRKGYSVEGWYLNGVKYDFSQPVYEDMDLYANWTVMSYTASFYDGEELLFTQKVNHGSKLQTPAAPVKEGYLFTGWYTDPELTTAYDFFKPCYSDIDLYASWRVDDRADYIYLNGQDGNDEQDGTTKETAVKTFERAKALLADSKNPVILICGQVTIDQDTTWSMADMPDGRVVRAGDFTKKMVSIKPVAEDASATLTLDHIVIDGGAEMWPSLAGQSMVWYMIEVESGGRLVLNDGAVLQNSAATKSMVGGAAYVTGNSFNPGTLEMNEGAKVINNNGGYIAGIAGTSGAHITINGGEISGNVAKNVSTSLPYRGSALGVSSGTANSPGVLTINGGVIKNNHSYVGTAVGLNQHAVGYLNGGVITGNVSDGSYGGISAYGDNGNSTWYLKGGTVTGNIPGPGYSDDQVAILKKAQLVMMAEEDSLEIGGIFLNTANGVFPVGVGKPLANVKGGGIQVTLDYMGTDTVLARGYGTYKLTAADTAAYHLTNSLEPYFKTAMDTENNQYVVASAQVIGAKVYLNGADARNRPGNDANDGLTPDTPVATFARAKEILAANAKETGDNIIYVLDALTIPEGTSETWSLKGIPNAMMCREETGGTSYSAYVYGSLTLEDIVFNGLCQYTAQSKTYNAVFRVDKGGSLRVKAGTELRNFRGSSQGFAYIFASKGVENNVVVEDLKVTGVQTYVSTTSDTTGVSLFGLYGPGRNNLTIQNGTFTDNQARLLYVTGAGDHQVEIENCVFSNNSVRGCGGVFLLANSTACNTVVNVRGGTFTDNRCATASVSAGLGAIAYVKSPAALHIYGGTFTGNTAALGEKASGFVVRGFNKSIGSYTYLHNLTGDVNLMTYPMNKSVNNAYFVIDAPLTHKVFLTDQNNYDNYIVLAGTETYQLTEADLQNVVSTNEAVSFYLDSENNCIRLKQA